MPYRLFLARHPRRPDAPRPLIIDDLLRLAHLGQRTCVRAAVDMCQDLHQNGMASRYVKHLGGPLYELKKYASDGGARVYFLRQDQSFILVHAECKKEDQATQALLSDALDILGALEGPDPLLQ